MNRTPPTSPAAHHPSPASVQCTAAPAGLEAISAEQAWQAILARDKSQRGRFVYGVLTTGIFCSPGCASRTPLRRNVRFYATAAEAAADNLRPCLRCKPCSESNAATSATKTDLVNKIRTYLRQHAGQPDLLKLEALSRHFHLSPFHLQRTFKAATGVTPKNYADDLRLQALKEELRGGRKVAEASYQAGFNSGSRVYARANTQLGMTPRQYRAHGHGLEISYATMPTPFGLLMLGATDRGLCFLEFGRSEADLLESLRQEFAAATLHPMPTPPSPEFRAWTDSLTQYLRGERGLGRLPAALHGTAFQLKVWNHLQSIPAGATRTYTQVAEAIGHPKAVRAVASACAANRLALVVPCHRVIRGDGSLGGYRWGLDLKKTLLDTEQQLSSHR